MVRFCFLLVTWLFVLNSSIQAFKDDDYVLNPFLTPEQNRVARARKLIEQNETDEQPFEGRSDPNETGFCSLLLPGLARMSKGIDVTSLDLFPSDIAQPGGFRQSIFEFTCKEGKTWKHPSFSNREYSWPDQVQSVTRIPAGSLSISTNFDENIDEVKKSMAAKVDLEVNAGTFGSFSGSTSYKEAKGHMLKTDKSVAETSATVSSIEFDLKAPEILHTSPYFESWVESLPSSYEKDPLMYDEFVDTFGTHYFDIAKFGGYLYQKTIIENSYVKDTNEKEVEANLKLSFKAFAGIKTSIGGEIEDTTKESKERFSRNTENNFYYYGGVSKFTTDEDENYMAKWWDTVNEDPWLFGGQIRPIEWLIKDAAKQNETRKAVVLKMVRAYRNDFVEANLISRKNFNSEIRSLLTQIDEYLNSPKVDLHSIKQREAAIKQLFDSWKKELKEENDPKTKPYYEFMAEELKRVPTQCVAIKTNYKLPNGTMASKLERYDCADQSYYEEMNPVEFPKSKSICVYLNNRFPFINNKHRLKI
ncbi:hypothetical protein BLOT_008841 [Blomia tropicalis]|nr:hypothetical protein BLOT_008841 [Blomia tropicalis]